MSADANLWKLPGLYRSREIRREEKKGWGSLRGADGKAKRAAESLKNRALKAARKVSN